MKNNDGKKPIAVAGARKLSLPLRDPESRRKKLMHIDHERLETERIAILSRTVEPDRAETEHGDEPADEGNNDEDSSHAPVSEKVTSLIREAAEDVQNENTQKILVQCTKEVAEANEGDEEVITRAVDTLKMASP